MKMPYVLILIGIAFIGAGSYLLANEKPAEVAQNQLIPEKIEAKQEELSLRQKNLVV